MVSPNIASRQIARRSPHLAQVLCRTFGEDGAAFFEPAFAVALRAGGDTEIDFERPAGASYNPRAARIPLIVIGDASMRDAGTVAASILLGASRPLCASDLDDQTEPVRALYGEALNGFTEELTSPPGICIALASHIDRARHLHLAAPDRLREIWPRFADEHRRALAAAEQHWPTLHAILVHWTNRVAPRLHNLSKHVATV